MPEEFNLQELKKQYPEFFKEFPAKLKDLIISDKTASQISEVCLKNGVEDEETIEKIAYHITSVLLGRLPSEILPKALKANMEIAAEVAEKIYSEIDRLIFSLVKDDLAKLYGKEIAAKAPAAAPPKPSPLPEEPKKPPGKDIYKEPVE